MYEKTYKILLGIVRLWDNVKRLLCRIIANYYYSYIIDVQ